MANATLKFVNWLAPKLAIIFGAPDVRDDVRESRRLFSESRLCWCIELFEFFCGSFRDLAHESCIKGANHARGGVLKSTLVVDNDSVHTQHAFSPTVMTICSHSSTDARSAMAQEDDPRHIVSHSRSVSSFFLFLIVSLFSSCFSCSSCFYCFSRFARFSSFFLVFFIVFLGFPIGVFLVFFLVVFLFFLFFSFFVSCVFSVFRVFSVFWVSSVSGFPFFLV